MTSFSAKSIVFILFDEFKLLDLTGPLQVFADANLHFPEMYDVKLVSAQGGLMKSDATVPVLTEAFSAIDPYSLDTVIVVGGPGAFVASKENIYIEKIKVASARARRLGSVCTGAFILAEAGILDGRKAVTHWESCARLQETYPNVKVKNYRLTAVASRLECNSRY